MKKLLLMLSVSLIALTTNSQTISVTADTLENTYSLTDYPSENIFFTNDSTGSIDISYDVISNTIPAAGWSATLCTDQVCMPTIPTTLDMGIYAAFDHGNLNMHVGFNSTLGSGEIGFKIYETANPSNFKIVYFIFHVVATGIADNGNEMKINTFPNPTTDFLTINGLDHAINSTLTIFNNNGSLVYTSKINSPTTIIDVANFSKGVYFLDIKNNNESFFTSRFIKK